MADRDSDGNRLPGVPEHFWRLGLPHRPDRTASTWTPTTRSARRSPRTTPTPGSSWTRWGAGVTNLRLGWHGIGAVQLSPFLGVNNLWDRRYVGSVTLNGPGRPGVRAGAAAGHIPRGGNGLSECGKRADRQGLRRYRAASAARPPTAATPDPDRSRPASSPLGETPRGVAHDPSQHLRRPLQQHVPAPTILDPRQRARRGAEHRDGSSCRATRAVHQSATSAARLAVLRLALAGDHRLTRAARGG